MLIKISIKATKLLALRQNTSSKLELKVTGVPFKNPHFIKKELPVPLMNLNTSKTFSMNIENIATEKNITHMEAVLDYCDRNDLEPDTVGNLISKSLKEKIEANARDLNFLPRQAQLPV
jgi:hypothetical protein